LADGSGSSSPFQREGGPRAPHEEMNRRVVEVEVAVVVEAGLMNDFARVFLLLLLVLLVEVKAVAVVANDSAMVAMEAIFILLVVMYLVTVVLDDDSSYFGLQCSAIGYYFSCMLFELRNRIGVYNWIVYLCVLIYVYKLKMCQSQLLLR